MAEWLKRWTYNSEALRSSTTLTAIWICSRLSEFISLAIFVNSQLVCLWPVWIRNPVKFDLDYLFQAICLVPLALVLEMLPRSIYFKGEISHLLSPNPNGSPDTRMLPHSRWGVLHLGTQWELHTCTHMGILRVSSCCG